MKKFKSLIIGFVVCFMLISSVAFADGEMRGIEVLFNGVNITVNDKIAQTDNLAYEGTTYVPLRAISEMLGKNVEWNGQTNTASINNAKAVEVDMESSGKAMFSTNTKQNIEVLFNRVNIVVNDKKVEADNIAYKGTTYVPLRAISEMLGKNVQWIGETNTASIKDFPDVKAEETVEPIVDNSNDKKQEKPVEKITSYGLRVKAGEFATATIKGTPNSTYRISVFYSSGPSKAKDLDPKVSDANGNVSWTWKVGSKTKPGKYRIVINGDKTEKLELEVL